MKNFIVRARNAVFAANKKVGSFVKVRVVEDQRGEVGVGIVLGIVLVILVFAFIVVPQGRLFVSTMFANLLTWYNGLNLFPTT